MEEKNNLRTELMRDITNGLFELYEKNFEMKKQVEILENLFNKALVIM